MEASFRKFAQNEREAWRSLEGCEHEPRDPYAVSLLDELIRGLPVRSSGHRWVDVFDAWVDATLVSWPNSTQAQGCRSGLILVSLFKGRVAAAICRNEHARRAQLGALGHYRVFKYILSAALAGMGTERPPDALFILDLVRNTPNTSHGDQNPCERPS